MNSGEESSCRLPIACFEVLLHNSVRGSDSPMPPKKHEKARLTARRNPSRVRGRSCFAKAVRAVGVVGTIAVELILAAPIPAHRAALKRSRRVPPVDARVGGVRQHKQGAAPPQDRLRVRPALLSLIVRRPRAATSRRALPKPGQKSAKIDPTVNPK